MTQRDALLPPSSGQSFPEPASLASHDPAHIVVMPNQEGEVGKTTTTIDLAAALATYGRKVLIVDFDPQGAASAGLGIDTRALDRTIYNELIVARPNIHGIIVETSVENLDIAPASIDLSTAEIVFIDEVTREQALTHVLKSVLDDYDLIVIGCQSSLGLLTVNALTAAHGVIIPPEAEYFAMRGAALLVEQIERVRGRLNPRLELDGVLPTMADTRTLHSHEVVKSVHKGFGESVSTTCISCTVKFPDASIAAVSITEYAPSHPGTVAYRQLAGELITRGRYA